MIPDDLRYTKDHEWVRMDGDTAVVGITDHAQQALGDITFVEPPPIGEEIAAGEEACAIESTKAAASVYMPVGGTIAAYNEELDNRPELLNESAYHEGWIFKITVSDSSEVDALMDAATYAKFLAEQEE